MGLYNNDQNGLIAINRHNRGERNSVAQVNGTEIINNNGTASNRNGSMPSMNQSPRL
jgi:hypothetical protein